MNAQSDKAVRRRRKMPARRVPALVEQPVSSPFIFGWGSHLNRHQREAFKERIALFTGIGLAVVILGLLGWGLLKDNVIDPSNQAAADNKPVVSVGNYTVTTGFFKKYEKVRYDNLQSQLATLQQEQQSLKKTDPLQSQITAQTQAINSILGNLAPAVLNSLIENSTLLQRASTLGVHASKKEVDAQMFQLEKAYGGKLHLQQYIDSTGLSANDFRTQETGTVLRKKVTSVLGAKVPSTVLKVRASHILVSDKQKALALSLLQQVKHGANFAALAKKYSKDPGSAKLGGDLGFVAQGAMVAPFDKAIFSMQPGQFQLVHTQYGWHVIKLVARKQAKRTPSELAQAKNVAVSNWLAQQERILRVQKFVAPESLPTVPGASNNALGNTSNLTNQLPVQRQPIRPSLPVQRQPIPLPNKPGSGKAGTKP